MKNRTMLSFALAAIAVAAMAVPAFASASEWKESGKVLTEPGLHWSKDGGSLKGESASIELTGPFYTDGEYAGVECTLSLTATLEPGSIGKTTGGSLSACKGKGMTSSCKVTSATVVNQPWLKAGEAGGKRVITTTGSLVLSYTMEGFLCPKKYEVGVPLTATPDNSAAIGSVSLYGLGTDSLGAEVEAGGTLAVTPAGKYGILAKNTVKLSGEMSWESELGGIHCPVNGTLELSAGSSGQVTAFNWSTCYGSGLMAACKVSITSNSLPWSATDEGETIKLAGISLSMKKEGSPCPPYNGPLTGELTATPNNTSAIGNTALSGALKDANGNLMSWYGSLNWTPTGIYGL